MQERIESFIAHKRLALLGASAVRAKFGNFAAKELRARGYDVQLVHPSAQTIDGQRCWPSLGAIEGGVPAVVLCLPAARGVEVLREAAQHGIRDIWIQQGADSADLLSQADELGLAPVWGKCILMYAQPVRSFHAVHRFFVRIFGRLYAPSRRPVSS